MLQPDTFRDNNKSHLSDLTRKSFFGALAAVSLFSGKEIVAQTAAVTPAPTPKYGLPIPSEVRVDDVSALITGPNTKGYSVLPSAAGGVTFRDANSKFGQGLTLTSEVPAPTNLRYNPYNFQEVVRDFRVYETAASPASYVTGGAPSVQNGRITGSYSVTAAHLQAQMIKLNLARAVVGKLGAGQLDGDCSKNAKDAATALAARINLGSPEQYHTYGFPANDGLFVTADANDAAMKSELAFDTFAGRGFLYSGDTPHKAAFMLNGRKVGIGECLVQPYLAGTNDLRRFATPLKTSAVYLASSNDTSDRNTGVVASPLGFHNIQYDYAADCIIAMPNMDMTYGKSRVRVFLESVDGTVKEISDPAGAPVTQVSNSAGQPMPAFSFNPGEAATTSAPFGQKTHVDFYYREKGDKPGTEREVSYWFSCFSLSNVGNWAQAAVENMTVDKITGKIKFDLIAPPGTEVTFRTADKLGGPSSPTVWTDAAKVVPGLPITRWELPKGSLGPQQFFYPQITVGNANYAATGK